MRKLLVVPLVAFFLGLLVSAAGAQTVFWSAPYVAQGPTCSIGAYGPSYVGNPSAGAYGSYVTHASASAACAPAVSYTAWSAPVSYASHPPAYVSGGPSCPASPSPAFGPAPQAFFSPAPYAAYRAPYPAVVHGRQVIVRPKVYVPGQPLRNLIRAFTP
jgi:hypothetical protein